TGGHVWQLELYKCLFKGQVTSEVEVELAGYGDGGGGMIRKRRHAMYGVFRCKPVTSDQPNYQPKLRSVEPDKTGSYGLRRSFKKGLSSVSQTFNFHPHFRESTMRFLRK
ncbi:hypothetical protein PV327_002907, partial [Microctonus hyperodae]